ncbi:hypothetical protein INR49_004976 [Caranx melampygus]|nr:hypothetical protein INR49_004976 [Caranx melampygus]
MRSLNYVQRVSLDFTGTLFPHAICLGDADNDSLNELVVGDTSGKLLVYKNDDSKPWITRTCVGMLTCVAIGDVCNRGKNLVVAVGAEGWFHLFDLTGAAAANKSDSSSQHEFLSSDDQRPFFTQHIPANTKVILISDIDGDGRCELVVGYTDRVVRAFRWEEQSDSTDLGSGQLVLLKKWLLEGQVDSLSVNPGPEGLPELMVSQPGCGYAILLCSWTQQDSSGSGDDAPATPGSEGPSRDVVLHLTTGGYTTRTFPLTSLAASAKVQKRNLLNVASSLSVLWMLMDSSEQLLWSVQVDHQLFALQKLDVTGDGREEVVACAWDGQTYIIDHNRTVVRFQFDENIHIYWKVELERMESTNLLRVLEEKPEFRGHLKALGVDAEDTAAVRELVSTSSTKTPRRSPGTPEHIITTLSPDCKYSVNKH